MATAPTIEQVERAIMEEISQRHLRGGDTFPTMPININLQKAGYKAAEIYAALQAMADKGWIETAQSPKFLRLTDAGFAEI